jgi:hypothetical protein
MTDEKDDKVWVRVHSEFHFSMDRKECEAMYNKDDFGMDFESWLEEEASERASDIMSELIDNYEVEVIED